MQHVNGFATLSLEYDLARRHCLSLTGSKRGVGNGDRIYPLQLRWSWYSNGHSDDSPFWYVEDGVGYNRDARVRLALTGGIGAGYRYRLGNHSFVDMAARVSYARYKPDLYDLAVLHGQARGEMASSREEADTVFALDEGITPFDADVWMADYI